MVKVLKDFEKNEAKGNRVFTVQEVGVNQEHCRVFACEMNEI